MEIANHKPLADIIEAVVAAVFVDSRFSLDTSWDVFGPIFKPLIGNQFYVYPCYCSDLYICNG